ncbi:hypothetical protein ZOD2009_16266 [Haladaptatus paucihalophilus DX253]|uniref:Uncharacterized protein n=1 Tax=Haladaptatus paucihalophilus DX253 TaxID=797209 RepID=E7QWR5_HALPU|nr:hypothetical protein ZOD2009_16266 [Haladaptatus paucihalophilus DX253]
MPPDRHSKHATQQREKSLLKCKPGTKLTSIVRLMLPGKHMMIVGLHIQQQIGNEY